MEFVVKFCPCNFEDELRDVKDQLRQLSNVAVIEDRCLNYCGQCLAQPYALVNGKNIAAHTKDELLIKIKEQMAKQPTA